MLCVLFLLCNMRPTSVRATRDRSCQSVLFETVSKREPRGRSCQSGKSRCVREQTRGMADTHAHARTSTHTRMHAHIHRCASRTRQRRRLTTALPTVISLQLAARTGDACGLWRAAALARSHKSAGARAQMQSMSESGRWRGVGWEKVCWRWWMVEVGRGDAHRCCRCCRCQERRAWVGCTMRMRRRY